MYELMEFIIAYVIVHYKYNRKAVEKTQMSARIVKTRQRGYVINAHCRSMR